MEKFSFTLNGKIISVDENAMLLDQQALTAYETRNYNKALELYSNLITSYPSAHQYYQYRGTVYEDMGNDIMAQKDFEKSIELEPKNTTSLYRFAMVYYRKNNLEKAIEYLRKAYNILSETDNILGKEFGYKDIMGSSYNNIIMVHRRVIACNLANFLIQTKKINEGMPILDELIQYCPTYAHPYFVKALYLYQNNEIQDALYYAQKSAQYGHPQGQSLVMHIKTNR